MRPICAVFIPDSESGVLFLTGIFHREALLTYLEALVSKGREEEVHLYPSKGNKPFSVRLDVATEIPPVLIRWYREGPPFTVEIGGTYHYCPSLEEALVLMEDTLR